MYCCCASLCSSYLVSSVFNCGKVCICQINVCLSNNKCFLIYNSFSFATDQPSGILRQRCVLQLPDYVIAPKWVHPFSFNLLTVCDQFLTSKKKIRKKVLQRKKQNQPNHSKNTQRNICAKWKKENETHCTNYNSTLSLIFFTLCVKFIYTFTLLINIYIHTYLC